MFLRMSEATRMNANAINSKVISVNFFLYINTNIVYYIIRALKMNRTSIKILTVFRSTVEL
jgi:hypothetical protein